MPINPAYLTGVGLYGWDTRRMKPAPKIARTTNSSPLEPFFPEPYSEGEIIFRNMNSANVQIYCAIADGDNNLYWMPVIIEGMEGRRRDDTGGKWSPYGTFPLTNFWHAR